VPELRDELLERRRVGEGVAHLLQEAIGLLDHPVPGERLRQVRDQGGLPTAV
jgi:hypothetical protein